MQVLSALLEQVRAWPAAFGRMGALGAIYLLLFSLLRAGQRYSAASLRSVTTEVLKLLNATEELLHGVEGGEPGTSSTSLPDHTDPKELDQHFSRLEENVRCAFFPSPILNMEEFAGSDGDDDLCAFRCTWQPALCTVWRRSSATWKSVPGPSAALRLTWSWPSSRSRWHQQPPKSISQICG